MLTKQEIKDWLLKNAVNDEGDLDLSDLDFSDFDGDVLIHSMKVKKSLYQDYQAVWGSLYQHNQQVGEDFINHKLKDGEYWEEKRWLVNGVIRKNGV